MSTRTASDKLLSHVSSKARERRLVASLDKKLAEVIIAKAEKQQAIKVRFNRMLLKFPELNKGFNKARQVFEEAGAVDGQLSITSLRTAVSQLGYELDDKTFESLVAAEDSNHDHLISADEFLVVCAICHLLKVPGAHEALDPEILHSFEIAEQSFLCFHSAKKGYVDSEELTSCMHETRVDLLRRASSSHGKDPIEHTSSARCLELDTDGDGRISFREFLFVLERWVQDAEDTEEDEKSDDEKLSAVTEAEQRLQAGAAAEVAVQ